MQDRELFHKPNKCKLFAETGILSLKTQILLREVMDANPEAVEEILKDDKISNEATVLALKKASTKEACGRIWQSPVSSLEFAAWAGDTELVWLLLKFVPNAQRQEALAQLEHLETLGCAHGKPLAAFETLLAAYRDNIKNFGKRSLSERDQAAVNQIGGAQHQLPGVGLQWFCDPEPFDPLPKFDRAPQRIYNLPDGFSLLSTSEGVSAELGSKFFLLKDKRGDREYHVLLLGPRMFEINESAISQLCEVRRAELNAIIQQLRTELGETSSLTTLPVPAV